MSDTPDPSKPANEEEKTPASTNSDSESAKPTTPSNPQIKAPSKPVKPPSKPSFQPKPQTEAKPPAKPESKPTAQPTKPTSQPAKPTASKPVSVTPTAKKKAAKSPGSSITFDKAEEDDTPSVTMMVIDGLAAAVAITFTILILQDVMPFL